MKDLFTNKKAELSFQMILITLGIVMLFILVSMSNSFAQKGTDSFNKYFEKGDFDADGIRNSLDSCPCDIEGADKAYLLKKPFPKNGIFRTKATIDRISTEDTYYIRDFLEESFSTGLYVSSNLSKSFVFSTKTHPDNSLFCSQPTGKGGKCSFADFVKTYFVLKDSGDDYVTVCRTPTDVCNELLRSKAKSLEEVSKNS
jgi:hypothetical protein